MRRDSAVSHAPLRRTQRTFSSVFNSSTPQRPVARSAAAAYGGRPLGPNSYNPAKPEWMHDPDRQTWYFSSKTNFTKDTKPLTAEIDFYASQESTQLKAAQGSAPFSNGLQWPPPPEPREVVRDPGLDEFSDAINGSVSSEVIRSSRRYASSFNSTMKRGANAVGYTPGTNAELGPGVYELPLQTVNVREPKRNSYTFKSQTSGSVFGATSNEPPDNVQSIQSAILNRHWTSKGSAFSTRERFPKVRPRWKD